jgi:hypothetical protein
MRSALKFFALGLLLLVLLNWLSQLPPEARAEVEEIEARLAQIPGHRAVLLGGSSAVAVDFPSLCLDGIPFQHDVQDLFEVAALGGLILERPNPPRYWFVEALPTAQLVDNGSRAAETIRPRRNLYRAMFALGDYRLIAGDWRQAFIAFAAPSLGSGAWSAHFERGARLLGLSVSAAPGAGAPALPHSAAEFAANAPAEALERKQVLRRMDYYDPDIGARAERALQDLNARIRARGGVMILVVPPMPQAASRATLAALPREVAQFAAMLRRLAARGAFIADDWTGPLAARPELFRDAMHLNPAGAAIFSRRLGANLRARNILPPAPACGGAR